MYDCTEHNENEWKVVQGRGRNFLCQTTGRSEAKPVYENGIDGADGMTGADLKKVLIEHFGL